eukprot:TRINITY_DN30697_c0_g1_i1.p1 TRINITY_DN30697_c0_g1~~TRINITY_DN30697_c0_g1_i1.p1  ORF type:complete len:491 (+),score=92.31 TRINITY_DN30697_c0_g1_i1:75-1547(+)
MLRRCLPRLVYGAGNSITVRLKLANQAGTLPRVLNVIADLGGHVGAIDMVRHPTHNNVTRDVSIDTRDVAHQHEILHALQNVEGATVKHWSDRTFLLHLGGKLETGLKFPVRTRDDYSMAYTPGVGRISQAIRENPHKARNLTIKKNTVAVVSDGTSVLALGDVGPEAALPVLEGLCMLLKEFGGVDAVPLSLAAKNTQTLIDVVTSVSPTFGGICLADIGAPRCFEVARALRSTLDIPVLHDDQHCTAVVVAAGLLNSLKVQKRSPADIRVVVAGAGASGTACAHMLQELGVVDITVCDSKGALHRDRPGLTDSKLRLASVTNPENRSGSLSEVLVGANVFIGLSAPGILTGATVKTMAPDPIVFTLASPDPEILPQEARDAGAAIVASARGDWTNQLSNVLAYPGIFRGALDVAAKAVNTEMLVAAAHALAAVVPEEALNEEYIVPSPFDRQVVSAVALAVADAAHSTGVALTPRGQNTDTLEGGGSI